jgi:uncharacterized protein involved in tellurium resistance
MESASSHNVSIVLSTKGCVIPYLLIMAFVYEGVEKWRERVS